MHDHETSMKCVGILCCLQCVAQALFCGNHLYTVSS